MKKLFFLAVLVVGLPACGSLFCDSTSCGCDSPGPVGHFDIEGVVLTATERGNAQTPQVVLPSNATVTYSLLQLQLTPNTRLVAAQPAAAGWGTAYACSPVGPDFLEQIDSLVVTSRYAYDAQHPAGSSLNDVVRVLSFNLNDYLAQQAGKPTNGVELSFAAGPAQTGPQQFRVRYRLTNGEVYTAETVTLVLAR